MKFLSRGHRLSARALLCVSLTVCVLGTWAGRMAAKPQSAEHKPAVSRSAAGMPRRQAASGTRKTLSASIRFIGRDDQTQGNWQGRYGRQGFLLPIRGGSSQFQGVGIFARFDNLPASGMVSDHKDGRESREALGHEDEHEGRETLFAWDKAVDSSDSRLPASADGLKTRQPVAFRGKRALAVRVDVKDSKPHQLAVYLLDYKRQGLAVSIEAFDGRSRVADTRRVDNYAKGAYLRYRFVGSILLVTRSLTTMQPPLLLGVFVDSNDKP